MKRALINFLALACLFFLGLGCFKQVRKIPETFRGEYAFNKSVTVRYWEAQADWPAEAKQRLINMATPTLLRIEADRIVITDIKTGQNIIQPATIRHLKSQTLELELFNNFARTNTAMTFEFDANGFWLSHNALFPNYRERFEKAKPEQK